AKPMEKVEGNIVFDHVSFSYDETKEVVHDITLDIGKGQKLALVGPSGGGKTTLCHLIPRFYNYDEGKLTIDGVDINDITLESLRRNIGIVQQDVFLFDGTIGENILYGRPDATYEEMVEAAKRANIDEYVATLPDGYDTQIGERGVKLSGGQKQRLSIARVFLKDPAILILDEATSALDNTTEILIQEALDELCKGRTTLVVAHRLSTVRNADRIVVVSRGKIIEEGTHDALIAESGVYAKLYSLQFREGESNLGIE
ncbi:MAG: ATP-binding cassette domain-containing protein, partial [Clostridia bacterium]|nr:ATP-binding cassette domain-containing protein [Clostridia bacterium]